MFDHFRMHWNGKIWHGKCVLLLKKKNVSLCFSEYENCMIASPTNYDKNSHWNWCRFTYICNCVWFVIILLRQTIKIRLAKQKLNTISVINIEKSIEIKLTIYEYKKKNRGNRSICGWRSAQNQGDCVYSVIHHSLNAFIQSHS